MITLITTLFLFTAVKTDIAAQVQKIRYGNTVTIKCNQNMDKSDTNNYLVWYKQGIGKVPKYVVRSLGEEKARFASDFIDRFSVDQETFDLRIKETRKEDTGTYFCGKVLASVIEFESGTLLFFQGEKTDHHPLTEMTINNGESVTLKCSVNSLTLGCSGEHSVYWFRHDLGEAHPGIIYHHGNRSDECNKSSETGSRRQSCVYKLPKRNLSVSDAGTYYCAVAACGHILFGNRTEVHLKEKNSWIIITLTASNITSVIVIIILVGVLLKNQQKGASSGRPSNNNQVKETNDLNYAALKFAKNPQSQEQETKVNKSQDTNSLVIYS